MHSIYCFVGTANDPSVTTYCVTETGRTDEGDFRPSLPEAQMAKLLASDGLANDFFSGSTVARSGDTALIGAWGDDGSAGSAYIFE